MAHPRHRIVSWTLAWLCASWLPSVAAADGLPTAALPSSCKWDNVIAQTAAPADWSPSGTIAGGTLVLHGEIVLTLPARTESGPCLGGNTEPTLFLDHLPLPGLPTTGRFVDNKNKKVNLRYRLERPPTNVAGWNELQMRAWAAGVPRSVSVGIGVGGAELFVLGDPVLLELGGGSSFSAWVALCVCAGLLALVWCKSNALHDRTNGFLSYSLSRLVLACWVLTTGATVFLMLRHTGLLPSFADGGLAFMLAATGFGAGASALLDQFRKPVKTKATAFWQDFFNDADGFALHRLQVLAFNVLVLGVVWTDLICYGTVAAVDKSWAALIGASTVTYLFGKSSESTSPTEVTAVTKPVPQQKDATSVNQPA